MHKAWKSIGAFLAGLVATATLSFGTDYLFEALGWLPKGMNGLSYASMSVLITIIVYRNMYNVLGGYMAARLAPDRPLGHALALGVFGGVGSLIVTIATWNMDIGPHGYSIAITVLAVPSAWLGGWLCVQSKARKAKSIRPTNRAANIANEEET
ncbi:MAG: hypothetical protein QOI63_1594 [Thermoplasmata archaeon]|jgi:hypothetical protein|nr:hypothetical protein [Thermoplasmata archaeon]